MVTMHKFSTSKNNKMDAQHHTKLKCPGGQLINKIQKTYTVENVFGWKIHCIILFKANHTK